MRATSALQPTHDVLRLPHSQSSDKLQRHATARSSRLSNQPKSSLLAQSLSTAHGTVQQAADSPPTQPFPSAETVAQSEIFQDAVFPSWKDDADSETLDDPEELSKKDPLGTQIWKLYSRTKTRLPNQERMENLTWRMMAMNLKRREREQAL